MTDKNTLKKIVAQHNRKVHSSSIKEGRSRHIDGSSLELEFEFTVTEDYSKVMEEIVKNRMAGDRWVEESEEEKVENILSDYEDQEWIPPELSDDKLSEAVYEALDDYNLKLGVHIDGVSVDGMVHGMMPDVNTVEEAIEATKEVELIYTVRVMYSTYDEREIANAISKTLKFQTELHTDNLEKSED